MKTLLKKVLVLAVLSSLTAFASAKSQKVCLARATVVEAIAVERDQGTKKEDMILRLEKQLGPRASGIRDYVEGVYLMRTSTPTEIRNQVFALCRAEQ